MSEPNDHDILVSLKTLMDVMIQNQSDFLKRYEQRHSELSTRISILESSDSKDSERFRSFGEQITRSLDNANKIEKLTADVNNLGENLRELKTKSNAFDIANATLATASGVVGFIFGNK